MVPTSRHLCAASTTLHHTATRCLYHPASHCNTLPLPPCFTLTVGQSVEQERNGQKTAQNGNSLTINMTSLGNVGQEPSPWGAVTRTGGTVA